MDLKSLNYEFLQWKELSLIKAVENVISGDKFDGAVCKFSILNLTF